MPALASAAAPGIGVLLYSAFIWKLTGDPLAWAEGHAAWGRQYSGLLPLAIKYYGYMAESGPYIFTVALPFDTLNGLGALFVHRRGVAGVAPLRAAVRGVHPHQHPPAAGGRRLSLDRTVLRRALSGLHLVRVGRARAASSRLDRLVHGVQALNAALFYTWHEMF